MKILIQNGLVLDMVSGDVKQKDILIEHDKIVKIGKDINEKDVDKIIDATSKAVMPGLINCHNHSGMAIFKGYSDDLELHEWLEKAIWPIEDNLTKEEIYYSSMLAIIEMIKSGTTTFNDLYFHMEGVAKAVEESGIRANLSRTILFENEEADKRLEEAENLYLKYNGKADGRIRIDIDIHAPYTCMPDTIKKAVALSEKYNTKINVHLSETEEDNLQVKEKYNMTPTKYLEANGLFTRPAILAHGVHLTDTDLEIIQKSKAGIAHNPISNCKLASGIADIIKYRKLGIPVGIGTDGSGSTNTLDMFEEMKLASYMQKILHKKASCINSKEILEMATKEGAKVLGLGEIGTIEEEKKADIILIDLNKPHLKPINDIYSTLVYSCTGQDVDTTIVDGQVIMENRKLVGIDECKIVEQCNQIAEKYFKKEK